MFVENIDFEKFEILGQIDRTSDSWSMDLLYEGKKLQISVPQMICTFTLKAYVYPNKPEKKNYSLCLTLDETKQGVTTFRNFLNNIDENVKSMADKEGWEKELDIEFNSPIRQPNKDFKAYLRCKMVSNKQKFKFQAFENGKPFIPTIEKIEKMVKRGQPVETIIQLNPIYKVDKYYGITYQIKAINFLTENFTFNPGDEKEHTIKFSYNKSKTNFNQKLQFTEQKDQ